MKVKEAFHYFFVPHQGNNHRAKALHVDSLFAYLLFFSLVNLTFRIGSGAIPSVLGFATNIYVQSLLDMTNQKRQDNGLTKLVYNEKLGAAAAKKAQDMFSNNYWAHFSPQGKSPWDFILSSGYTYTLAGENLAKNFNDSSSVVDAWMHSPSHKENLLKPGYQDVGFAVVNGTLNGEETTLVVQMFGSQNKPVSQNTTGSKVQTAAQSSSPSLAQAMQPTAIITPTTTPVPIKLAGTDRTSKETIIIPDSAAQVAGSTGILASFQNDPFINIASLSREIMYVFLGIFIGVLALDAWIVGSKGLIRVSGHNLAHIAFFVAIVIGTFFMQRGSLL